MKEKVYAAIDIGSNAVRLLIKKVDDEASELKFALKKQLLLRVPLRLGFDVFQKGEVSDKKSENLIRLMKAYKQLIRIYDVDRLRACATSAMRDAANGSELIKKIKKECDIDIEIIPGEEEARIVYNNHFERAGLDDGDFLYVDVGGGSTELNLLSSGELKASCSFNIGTVRIITGKVKESEWARMNEFLTDIHRQNGDLNIIGSGGNINKLYKLAETKDLKNSSFSVEELGRLYHAIEPLSMEKRMDIYNLRSDRADVIIPAAEIFLNIASLIKARRIIVPTIGVADGIIDGMYLSDRSKRFRETQSEID
ncbi:MAG: Ppx/GppA family phosphatase [Candidatus Amulumruptor caecigallinarius]|nr:Ppx/GppA family phosphatase [Candidatus Amulumruptor caecigallinarius]